MAKICLYFQVHQPYRLLEYNFFQIGKHLSYINDGLNKIVIDKVANNCYLPANEMFAALMVKSKGKLKLNFAVSGTALSQFKSYQPEVLQSFQKLFSNNGVEILSETYYHSLASMFRTDEFEYQIKLHQNLIFELFGKKSTTFRNTELLYKNTFSTVLKNAGFNKIITEGVDRVLPNKNGNILLKSKDSNSQIFCRNYILSDDIAFRFLDPTAADYPITAKKMIAKIKKQSKVADYVFIGMDYETIGEHFKSEEGIFEFWNDFITQLVADKEIEFCNFSDFDFEPNNCQTLDSPDLISWADTEKDASAWMGNSLQYEALRKIYDLQKAVFEANNEAYFETWRLLQTSDHFYYMSTKRQSDGEVHSYFSPFNTPYDAYVYYMNIVSDFEILLKKK